MQHLHNSWIYSHLSESERGSVWDQGFTHAVRQSPLSLWVPVQDATGAASFTPGAAANAWRALLSAATGERLLADQLSQAHKNASNCTNISYDSLLFEQAEQRGNNHDFIGEAEEILRK